MSYRHTVLVVDDEPDVVKSVKDLLRLDYRVIGATSAQEGMQILENEDVQIVMTDQRMPEMTGVELLHKVRSEHPDAIRLLFTGYADIRAVIDAINEGNVYRYITKPWDPDELQTVIREACERHDLIVQRNRLLKELQRKNEQLEDANRGLVETNELKDAFIKVASHELRTPLTILLGITRLAIVTGTEDDPAAPWLKRIETAGKRLQHLINQIIEMLSAHQFARPLELETVDVAALLRDAADDVRPFVEQRKQTLALELTDDIGTASLDVLKIRDSVNHLLLNAIKFTPDGGTITLSARSAGDKIEIHVQDLGVGISPEVLPRLFEPFFTGFDVSHHSSGVFEYGRKGIGLGLSVVKAFIEMHLGTVSATSEVGRGTHFTITLPRATTAVVSVPVPAQS